MYMVKFHESLCYESSWSTNPLAVGMFLDHCSDLHYQPSSYTRWIKKSKLTAYSQMSDVVCGISKIQ